MIKKLIIIVSALSVIITMCISTYAADNIYRRVASSNMQIALTFDDGPHPGRTPEILDILEKYGVKATFFVIGQNVEYYPDVFERTVAEGHEIGNHTFSHKCLHGCDENELNAEFSSFESAVSKYNCDVTINIRPPEGRYDDMLKNYADVNGLNIVLWSVDTHDWAHESVDRIVENVLSNTDGGDIILMHDYISGKSPTPEALEIIIPKLIERGFEFVTVSELIKENTR